MIPERSINHHFTCHVAQASQAKHGSLVDRGANDDLAGSDVRILTAILDKHKKVMNSPKGYHRIKVHLVLGVKFDGRHKARFVADGHLTPEPIERV